MSTATFAPATRTDVLEHVQHVVHQIRWAPAPTWEPGRRLRFVGYVAGSMVAWTLAGLACSALLARLVGLVG
jgi:hypothetical protein